MFESEGWQNMADWIGVDAVHQQQQQRGGTSAAERHAAAAVGDSAMELQFMAEAHFVAAAASTGAAHTSAERPGYEFRAGLKGVGHCGCSF